MRARAWRHHAWVNRLQTLLLMLVLMGIATLAGGLLLGEMGLYMALFGTVLALLLEPAAASLLTLRLYRARPIAPEVAPQLWLLLRQIAERADLPVIPIPHYVPSPMVNAFAVGGRQRCAIALTDGMLRRLTLRELAGVLAHETAHIAHGDLRVMGLADYVSRLTSLFAMLGQLLFLLMLPWMLFGDGEVNGFGLLLLILAPHFALLAQLGLSRVREFDADLMAAGLTGDPEGLASALARIEQASRSWRWLLMPGWGNPEPSWLRTHPDTKERIRRLLALQVSEPMPRCGPEVVIPPQGFASAPVRRTPRWRIGGLWH